MANGLKRLADLTTSLVPHIHLSPLTRRANVTVLHRRPTVIRRLHFSHVKARTINLKELYGGFNKIILQDMLLKIFV